MLRSAALAAVAANGSSEKARARVLRRIIFSSFRCPLFAGLRCIWPKFTGSGERRRRERHERPKPRAVPSKNQDEPSGLFRLVLRNEGSLEVTKDGNDRAQFTGQTNCFAHHQVATVW